MRLTRTSPEGREVEIEAGQLVSEGSLPGSAHFTLVRDDDGVSFLDATVAFVQLKIPTELCGEPATWQHGEAHFVIVEPAAGSG